ncbi:MAG: hypothetical protein KBA26_10850 [Candidatus Delongbacteria bacterium]|nr:hypothetical protein [Candidatus Delongbacteria bacterium]
MSPILYSRINIIKGGLVYGIGDTIAALITHHFSLTRCLGVVLVGATLYALEIPNYFRWIDQRTRPLPSVRRGLARTMLALLYFNPIWITRHLVLINLFSGQRPVYSLALVGVAVQSFLWNIPISLTANFLIQNKVIRRRRFLASALFSASMAVYYALSEVIFR